ncbi:disease resistance-like protein DSC1 isoform X2 [Euphorbia lathyris]|uniref:disease resistance-like protein DSC1 isoform X2 n=1 Tax=Euphorbia lathyris TaxID=212925 RepID=UPI003313DF03
MTVRTLIRVDPCEVEDQTGVFGEGFDRAKEQAKGDMRLVKKWKAALKDAANISGFDSASFRPDSKLINIIVDEILKKLKRRPSSDTEGLIGIESSLEEVERLLNIGFSDARVVGIWGMGGIGKSTIAGAVYNRISALFDSCCFLANVREESEKMGLYSLHQELFSILLDDNNLNIHKLKTNLTSIKARLHRKKVLVVIDDVSSLEQLELLPGLHWFGPGSRIIITTRDRHLLVSHSVDFVYEVRDLNEEHALELLSRYAFKQKYRTEEFTKLSMLAIDYCKGLPLALKVLGSSLYGRSESEWISFLKRLEKHFDKDIQQILRISFDGLDDPNKSIFLDIACYFRGHDKDYVAKVLNSFGFFPEYGIRELIDHSLLTMLDNTVGMHDLLQDMGREIVRQQSPEDPGKRSRLWDHEDALQVLMQESGTEYVECMVIDLSKLDEKKFSVEAFMKMKNLRLLDVHGAYGDRKIHLSGEFECLYYQLKCLSWEGYPLKCLPSNFNPKKIIIIEMPHSSITRLWEGILGLKELQFIDLSHSQCLTETPDFTGVPNLELLILEGCTSLSKVHPSIGVLKKLTLLNIKDCNSLESLPKTIELESLNKLLLSGCSKLGQFPEIVGSMKHLSTVTLDGTSIAELPLSMKNLTGLVFLSLRNCKNLGSLPSEIKFWRPLKNLDLFGCSKLDRLPESLGNLKHLEKLDLGETAIRQPPSSIRLLRNLKILSFYGNRPILSWWSYMMNFLWKRHGFVGLSFPSLKGLHSLQELDLSDCNLSEEVIPEDFYCLSSLEVLHIGKNNFVNMPASISRLPQLRYLFLDECKSLKALRKLPATIHEISANNCKSLDTLSSPEAMFADVWMWPIFYFTNCFKLAVNQGNGSTSTAFEFLRSHLQSLPMTKLQDASSYSGRRFDVIVPGTEIPDWFSEQKMGASVTIQLSPDWYNEKFKGLVVCTVLITSQFLRDNPASDIAIYCKLEAIGYSATSSFKFLIYKLPYLECDHLWMGFHSRIGFGKQSWLNNCHSLRVSFESSAPGVEIRKCGTRLVYDDAGDTANLGSCENSGVDCEENGVGIMVEGGCELKRSSDDEEEEPCFKQSKDFFIRISSFLLSFCGSIDKRGI